jgi:hypothetical protein
MDIFNINKNYIKSMRWKSKAISDRMKLGDIYRYKLWILNVFLTKRP